MYMYDHCMYIHAYVNCKFFKAEISIIISCPFQYIRIQLFIQEANESRQKEENGNIYHQPLRDQSTSDPHNKTVRNPNRTIYQQKKLCFVLQFSIS